MEPRRGEERGRSRFGDRRGEEEGAELLRRKEGKEGSKMLKRPSPSAHSPYQESATAVDTCVAFTVRNNGRGGFDLSKFFFAIAIAADKIFLVFLI